jgi:hypothetical protein
MKMLQLPAPNGMPARMGRIQWCSGVPVQENQIWPIGSFWVRFVGINHLADQRFGCYHDQTAHSDSNKRKAADAWTPAAQLGEDYGVGDEAEVEDAVDERDVEVPEDEDGLGEGHDEGSAEVDFEQGQEGLFVVVAAPVSIVVGFLSSFCRAGPEDGGCVCFGD